MADGSIRLTASMCKTCEGCGKSGSPTVKWLCRECMAEHKKIRRTDDKRASHGRIGLPPILRRKSNKDPVTHRLHTCLGCGSEFYPKHADRAKFCGRACGLAFTGLQAALRASRGIVRQRVMRAKCKHCGGRFNQRNGALYCGDDCRVAAAEVARIDRERAAYVPRTFNCKCCGAEVVTHYGDVRTKYCGAACMKRVTKKPGKKSRQARLRGARNVERVDPLKVFDRDGWRCGICGNLTLRSMRGKVHPRAPELDHIVTIADGGEHTYANTQCACRKCNGAKGAKTYGQLNLFPQG